MAGKEVKVSFMIQEELAEQIARLAFDLDKDKSKVLRSCIIVGLPIVRDYPNLEEILPLCRANNKPD